MNRVIPYLDMLLRALNTECFDHFNWGNVKNSYSVDPFSIFDLSKFKFLSFYFWRNFIDPQFILANLDTIIAVVVVIIVEIFQALVTFTPVDTVFSYIHSITARTHHFKTWLYHPLSCTNHKKNISDAK